MVKDSPKEAMRTQYYMKFVGLICRTNKFIFLVDPLYKAHTMNAQCGGSLSVCMLLRNNRVYSYGIPSLEVHIASRRKNLVLLSTRHIRESIDLY